MRRILLYCIALGLAGGLALPLRAEEEGLSAEPVPEITFAESIYDAGETWEGEPVTHVFTFTNTGSALLEISRVRAGCGCTASNLSSDKIAPGESGEIKVTFNTRGYRGRKAQNVYVTSNAPGSPTLGLTLVATIKTAAAFSPPNLQFGRVLEGRAEVREISLVFDEEPVPVGDITVAPDIFSARRLEAAEAGPIRIEVTLSPEAPAGRHRGTLTAQIDHPRLTSLTARLHAVVEGIIQYSPRTLFFNQSDQAEKTVHTISIVNQGEPPMTLRGAASQIREFEVVEMKTIEPGKEFAVTVRQRPNVAPGKYSGEIRIVLAGPEEEMITIPLQADISR